MRRLDHLVAVAVGLLLGSAPYSSAALTGSVASPGTGAGLNVTIGDYTHVYNPGLWEQNSDKWTWYVNDHTFILGPGGQWHLFGITHTDPADPECETNMAHAFTQPGANVSAPHPTTKFGQAGFSHAPFVLGAKPPETHLWAPYVFRHDGVYHMFYCGGGDNRLMSRIAHATSTDMWNWQRHGVAFEGGVDGRDPMVLDRGEAYAGKGRFYIYYTGNDPDTLIHHNTSHVHFLRKSDDLMQWSPPTISFVCAFTGHNYGGPCESPTVVQRGPDSFYLFTGTWNGHYSHTHVFHSRDPSDFGSHVKGTATMVGKLYSHAPEVVRDVNGDWYLSRCGWGQLGVYLAPLHFEEPLTHGAHTWPSIPDASIPALGNNFSTNVASTTGSMVNGNGGVNAPGQWQPMYFPTNAGEVYPHSYNGSDVFLSPSGLAIGDALNETWIRTNNTQQPGKGGCTSVLKMVTKDGNPHCYGPQPGQGRFTSSYTLLPWLSTSQDTYLGVNITLNSYNDSAAPPVFGMVIRAKIYPGPVNPETNELVSSTLNLPFGEMGENFKLVLNVSDDGTLLMATAYSLPQVMGPNPLPAYYPGVAGMTVTLSVNVGLDFVREQSPGKVLPAALVGATKWIDLVPELLGINTPHSHVAMTVRQGSTLVESLQCDF